VKLRPEFHIVKGVTYKSGVVATMLIDSVECQEQWKGETNGNDNTSGRGSVQPPNPVPPNAPAGEIVGDVDSIDTAEIRVSSSVTNPAVKSFKKGFLNAKEQKPSSAGYQASDAAAKLKFPGASSENAGAGKIVEISEDISSDKADTSPGGVVTPKYTLIERGNAGMGDFDAMKANFVSSNRPAEIIIKIELPKINSAAAVDLDVAEKEVNLVCKDLYSLKIALPYPVYDKKGLAKFDKKSKSLSVSIPVKPHENQPVSSGDGSRLVEEKPTEGEDQGHLPAETSPLKNNAPRKPEAGTTAKIKDTHARWVSNSEGVSDDSKTLREEIQHLAKEAVEKNKLKTDIVKGEMVNLPVSNGPKIGAGVNVDVGSLAFIQSPHFVGSKKGYIFTTKAQGTGYYLDINPAVRNVVTETEVEKAKMDVPHSILPSSEIVESQATAFSFDCRQNLETVSVLVQVPRILPDSVKIVYHSHTVDIEFKTETLYHRMILDLNGSILPSSCRHDVSDKNMVVLLSKADRIIWTCHDGVDDHLKLFSVDCGQIIKGCRTPVPTVSAETDSDFQSSGTMLTSQQAAVYDVDKLKDSLKSLEFQSTAALFELD
jgi:hypothetical protein